MNINYDNLLCSLGFPFGMKAFCPIVGLSDSRVKAILANDKKRSIKLIEEANEKFKSICSFSDVEFNLSTSKSGLDFVKKEGYKSINEFCEWVGLEKSRYDVLYKRYRYKLIELAEFGRE